MLVSSSNSRRAASRKSSPCSTMPFGMVHAPASRSFQNGPPGWAMNTSSPATDRRKRRRPALTLGRLVRGMWNNRWIAGTAGSASRRCRPLRRSSLSAKIASDRHSHASPTMLHKSLIGIALALTIGVAPSICTPLTAQESVDRAMMARLSAESQAHSRVLESYRTLTDVIGPRLTGSPGFKRAVDWTRDRLTEWGMSNVAVEPFPFGSGWALEKFTLEMTQPRYFPLEGYPEAWTPSTRGVLATNPIYLGDKTADQIKAMGAKLK